MTASTPFKACSGGGPACGSHFSISATATPLALSGERDNPTTACPSLVSARQMLRPINPVAPVTSIFIPLPPSDLRASLLSVFVTILLHRNLAYSLDRNNCSVKIISSYKLDVAEFFRFCRDFILTNSAYGSRILSYDKRRDEF